ncbi:MAG: hypothetical protein CVU39_08320 [Chloroflexi bacterium HGW-Chloroflexi-10]|nr:MAG: hypothetical protein CVU39_08320 [Chloroflexi bacterium HGW-Chloroflexi-10]
MWILKRRDSQVQNSQAGCWLEEKKNRVKGRKNRCKWKSDDHVEMRAAEGNVIRGIYKKGILQKLYGLLRVK